MYFFCKLFRPTANVALGSQSSPMSRAFMIYIFACVQLRKLEWWWAGPKHKQDKYAETHRHAATSDSQQTWVTAWVSRQAQHVNDRPIAAAYHIRTRQSHGSSSLQSRVPEFKLTSMFSDPNWTLCYCLVINLRRCRWPLCVVCNVKGRHIVIDRPTRWFQYIVFALEPNKCFQKQTTKQREHQDSEEKWFWRLGSVNTSGN